MQLQDITALVLTYNEAPNIDRTLAKLREFRRIVVVDSGSDDGTQALIARYTNAEIVVRAFDTFADQCNFGLAHAAVATDWVLSLDADYVLDDELVLELAGLAPSNDVSGYQAAFRYCIEGKVIRSGVYPPVTILFRKSRAKFVNDGHGHRVRVDGRVEKLLGTVRHDDRKPLARWLDSQKSYAHLEADKLERANEALRWQDKVRLVPGVAPPLMFLYVYFGRGGFLDGWHGFQYALQRAYAELLLSIELLDRKLRRMTRP